MARQLRCLQTEELLIAYDGKAQGLNIVGKDGRVRHDTPSYRRREIGSTVELQTRRPARPAQRQLRRVSRNADDGLHKARREGRVVRRHADMVRHRPAARPEHEAVVAATLTLGRGRGENAGHAGHGHNRGWRVQRLPLELHLQARRHGVEAQ